MKLILFDKNTTKGNFKNYGYGKLKKVSKCEVVEELNGRYDIEIIISMSDPKQKLIKKWCVLYLDGQLFRVVNRKDIDKSNEVRIFAKHIFYDIDFGFIIDNKAENKRLKEALEIAIPTDFKGTFETDSDINDINTLYFVKNNGVENVFNIIERWGKGELIRDNFNIKINHNKGSNKGVTFTYKKIDAIEIDEDVEEVVTRLYPTGKDGLALPEKYIIIPNWNSEEYPPFHITKEVNFSDAENEGMLREAAKKHAEELGASRVNFKINVHDLLNTNLAKHMPQLYEVEVGDIVTLKHPKLDLRVKVKCIKKVHEKVTNKLALEFGQPLENFFDSIDNSNISIEMPSLEYLKEGFYYYTNIEKVDIETNIEKKIASIDFSAGDSTNLLLYFNMFGTALKAENNIEIIIKVDNQALSIHPKARLIEGDNIVSYTIPLIGIESNTHKRLEIFALMKNGAMKIETEQIQIVLKGRNLNGGIGNEQPKANIVENITFTDVKEERNISTKYKIEMQEVINVGLSENLDMINVMQGVTIPKTNVTVGLIRVADETNFNKSEEAMFEFDKELLEFDGATKVKSNIRIKENDLAYSDMKEGTLVTINMPNLDKFKDIKGVNIEWQ